MTSKTFQKEYRYCHRRDTEDAEKEFLISPGELPGETPGTNQKASALSGSKAGRIAQKPEIPFHEG
jgi:hypothetical protein